MIEEIKSLFINYEKCGIRLNVKRTSHARADAKVYIIMKKGRCLFPASGRGRLIIAHVGIVRYSS
jgi:hypothetical protein